MRGDDKILDLQKERAYLSAQLEEATKELARLDLSNLILTRGKKQAFAAFNFIKIIQEKIESTFTIDDLYLNVVKAITDNLCMDSAALLKINRITRDISISSSSGLQEKVKLLKLDGSIPDQEVFKPTFVNSNSSLQTFHKFIINSFKHPFFIWYPLGNEDDGTLVLFAGNKFEDLMLKQPFSETSLEAFGAIFSVVLLRKDNIAKTMEMIRRKEERIDFLAEILKASPLSVIATDWDAKITYANPAMEKLFGYKPEELIGKDPGILNAELNAAEIQENIMDAVRKGNVWKGEILNKKKDGGLFYVHASIYPVQDKDGNFVAFVGFQEDITERKKAEQEREYLFKQVRMNQEQLQSLSRRLMDVQEADHSFLASELHDQIGQNLTALSINLSIINSEISRNVGETIIKRLEDSLKLVEETMERIRDIMAELRPPVLDDYGLVVALRWYIERFSERTGVVTILKEEGSLLSLPLAIETAILRIVQEVLTNVAKHANAKWVHIILKRTNGLIQLVIADNGIGFDPEAFRQLTIQPRWGLITLEERARALGGHLYIKSIPGEGTRVIVHLPC